MTGWGCDNWITYKGRKDKEEEQRKRRQHPLSKPINRRTLRDKTWQYISDFCEGKSVLTSQQVCRKLPSQAEVRLWTLQVGGPRVQLGREGCPLSPGPWPCEAHQGPLLPHVSSSHWPTVLLQPCRAACLETGESPSSIPAYNVETAS